ncbi:MAG TPA: hypothetical protein VFA63_12370 [Pseudonocardiaceae bacterium]|nr:hypothetical protein [Pseudonocardiaceae bacterium]
MSVFVSSPSFPFVIEYPSDPKEDVQQLHHLMLERGGLSTWVAHGTDREAPVTTLINFAQVAFVQVSEDVPDEDTRPRVRTTLGEWSCPIL